MKSKTRRQLFPNLGSWLRAVFERSRKRRRASTPARLQVECLESRLTPSTFTDQATTTLTITLDQPGEAITFINNGSTITIDDTGPGGNITPDVSGTGGGLVTATSGSATITTQGMSSSQHYTQIDVVDELGVHGVSVNFAGNGTAYTVQSFDVSLTSDKQSGNVSFTGANTFTNEFLTVATNGNIVSAATSSLALTGEEGNLSLKAGNNSTLLKKIELAGTVSVSGTTALDAYNILAATTGATYTLTGAVSLTVGDSIALNAAGNLDLGNSTITTNPTGTAALNSTITASGNITQDIGTGLGTTITVTAGNNSPVNFVSTGGSIDLADNSLNNTFIGTPGTGAVGLSVTGGNPASIAGTGSGAGTTAIELGAVTTGTGLLSVTSTNGDITQGTPNVNTLNQPLNLGGGGATFTVLSASSESPGNVKLGTEANNITGPITFTDPDGLSSFALRNISLTPPVPTFSDAISGLTLVYDNAGLTLSTSINVGTGNVSLTAGGDIIEGSNTITAGSAQFAVTNDAVINVANTGNAISGAVSFNADNGESNQAVCFVNSEAAVLGASTLGQGVFKVSAAGNITETGAIIQAKAAGQATFSSTGTTVDLSTAPNDFSGAVQVVGSSLTTFDLRNADDEAALNNIMALPATVANFKVLFDNAPIVIAPLPVQATFQSSAVPAVVTFKTTAVTSKGIQLATSTTLQAGDQVVYQTTDTTDTPVSGLVGGNIYTVFSVTNGGKTIQLASPSNPGVALVLTPATTSTASAATETLQTTNIHLTTPNIFQVGEQVIYQTSDAAAVPINFTAASVTANAITFAANTNFKVGDLVVYQTTDPGDTPIGGLVNGQTYTVLAVTNSGKTVTLQNPASPTQALVLTPATTGPGLSATDSLEREDESGLVNGGTYVISGISTSVGSKITSIQLATVAAPTTPLTLIPAATGSAGAAATQTLIAAQQIGGLQTGTFTFNGNLTLGSNLGVWENNAVLNNSGTTTLASSGPAPIQLAGANNLSNITVDNAENSTGNVVLNSGTALNFVGESSIGAGRLIITAPGITEGASASIATAGLTSLTSTAGVALDEPGNSFGGRIDASMTGASSLTLGQGTGTLTLGNITMANSGSSLAVNTGAEDASNTAQASGTSLQIAGASSFGNSAGGSITLTDASVSQLLGNNFTGTVSLATATGNAALTNGGAVTLGTVSVGGNLSVTAGGVISQVSSTDVSVAGNASFNAGTAAITLTASGNAFDGDVNLTSNGTAAVAVAGTSTTEDANENAFLQLGVVTLGSGSLSVTSGGDILEDPEIGAITQTGAGAITLTPAAAGSVILDGPGVRNNFLGNVTVDAVEENSTSVDIENRGNLNVSALNPIAGNLILIGGGTVTLPSVLTDLSSLTVAAASVTVDSNITTSDGGASFTGGVKFTGNAGITIDTSASSGTGISFTGNVDATQSGGLTFNVQGADVSFGDGTWNQGANNLTIADTTSSTADNLQLGTAPGDVFVIASGSTITTANDGNFNVNAGTFKVLPPPSGVKLIGTPAVTIASGAGNMDFAAGTALEIGLGATPDQLLYAGNGNLVLASGVRLVGDGPATVSGTVIYAPDGGSVVGSFAGSLDPFNNPAPFFIGSDFVMADYIDPNNLPFPTQVVITQATTANFAAEATAEGYASLTGEGTNTVSGLLSTGEPFSVTSSLPAGSAGLYVLQDPNQTDSALQIVVTSTTATASTLTISTGSGSLNATKPGMPFFTAGAAIRIDGLGVDAAGAVTIVASNCDLVGNLTTAGTLTSLQLRDIGTGPNPVTITGGGPITGSTAMSARQVDNVTVNLSDKLSSLQATSVLSNGDPSSFRALSFGTITISGNASLPSLLNPSQSDPGNFEANLTSVGTASSALTTVSVVGTVGGTWDLGGSVGTVSAAAADDWQLGVAPAPLSVNGDGITSISSLSLGAVTDSGVDAGGAIGSLATTDVNGLNVRARSVTSLSVVGDGPHKLNGNAIDLDLTLLGAANATALGTLSVNGNLVGSTIGVGNGSIGTIAVLRQVDESSISAAASTTGGSISTITAGDWASSNIDARNVTALSITGNLTAGLLGNLDNSTVILRGNLNGTALQTLTVAGNAVGDTFDVLAGNVSTITIGRALDHGAISLTDPSLGNLAAIKVGQWGPTADEALIANTVGSLSAIGAAGSLASGAPALPATLANSTITLYNAQGTSFSLGSLTVAGTVESDVVTAQSSIGAAFSKTASARSGIGAISVTRDISGTTIVADDANPKQPALGGIASMSVGALGTNGTDLFVSTTLGPVSVVGFTTPEGAVPRVDGYILNTTLQVNGNAAFPTASTLSSLTVAGGITSSRVVDSFGITTLSAGGSVNNSVIVTENPVSPNLGFLTSMVVGDVENATLIRASTLGKLQTTGSTFLGLLGSVASSAIVVTAWSPPTSPLTTLNLLSVAGDLTGSEVDVPGQVTAITVLGQVTGSELSVATLPGTSLANLTVGQCGGGLANGVGVNGSSLTSGAVVKFSVVGNVARGLLGYVTGYFDIFSNSNGMGLQTFSSTAAVQNSIFRLAAGSVGSFTATSFTDADLLVGARLPVVANLTTPLTAADWDAFANQLSIASFTTTATTASFARSDVVAASLGKITLASVTAAAVNPAAIINPTLVSPLTFGIGFRSSLATMGTLSIGSTIVTPPYTTGQFHYLGLAG